MTPLQTEVLALARSLVGMREHGKNAGPDVERMLAHVGRRAGEPWCASFVSYCVHKAALAVTPEFHGSASALRLATRNEELLLTRDGAFSLLDGGGLCVFVMDHGGGKGHCGFAYGLDEDRTHILSIEGNTGPGPGVPAADREGDGVYERHDRRFGEVDLFVEVA